MTPLTYIEKSPGVWEADAGEYVVRILAVTKSHTSFVWRVLADLGGVYRSTGKNGYTSTIGGAKTAALRALRKRREE